MAVMISKNKKDLMVTCDCGCNNGFYFRLCCFNDIDSIMMSVVSGNYYQEQKMSILEIFRTKWKRIWSIIRNKDYCYSELCLSKEDFLVFKEYIGIKESDMVE